MGIYEKLLRVVSKEIAVNKTGHNDKQNYDYAEIAVIKEAIKKVLIAEKLVYRGDTLEVTDRVTEGKTSEVKITRVKVKFTLTDTESKELIESVYYGDGMDYGDKGIYKAYTGAEKYYLIQTFEIAIGDDAENDGKNGTAKTSGELSEKTKQEKPQTTEHFPAVTITAVIEKDWKGSKLTEYSGTTTGGTDYKVTVWKPAAYAAGDVVQFKGVQSKISEKYGTQYTASSGEKMDGVAF